MKPIFFYLIITILSLFLSACTENIKFPQLTTNATDKTLFSSLAELSYTPPQVEYRLNIGDVLDVEIFQAEELSHITRVDSQGTISLPKLGRIQAQGLSIDELQNIITERHRVNLQNPQVTIFIKEQSNQRITVEGEVKSPGIYPIKGHMTLIQAIAHSKGLTPLASPSRIILFRRYDTQIRAYQLDFSMIRSGKSGDPYLQNNDRIVVHRSDSKYWLKEVGQLIAPINFLRSFLPN